MTDNLKLILLKIGDELLQDPMKRGYSGKTNAEIVTLLNSPYTKNRTEKDQYNARISTILLGIENAPNLVTVDMINQIMLVASQIDGGITNG